MKILNDFQFRSAERSSHPWGVWADGKIRELTRGADFDCKITTIATQARGYARKNGMKVRISLQTEHDAIVLQFFTPSGEAAAPAKRKGKAAE